MRPATFTPAFTPTIRDLVPQKPLSQSPSQVGIPPTGGDLRRFPLANRTKVVSKDECFWYFFRTYGVFHSEFHLDGVEHARVHTTYEETVLKTKSRPPPPTTSAPFHFLVPMTAVDVPVPEFQTGRVHMGLLAATRVM